MRSNAHLSEADLRAKLLAPTTEPSEISSPPNLDLPRIVRQLSPTALEFFPQALQLQAGHSVGVFTCGANQTFR